MAHCLAEVPFTTEQIPTTTGCLNTTNYQTNLVPFSDTPPRADAFPRAGARSGLARGHPRHTKRTQQILENNGPHT